MSAIQAGIEDVDTLKKSQPSNWVFYQNKNTDFGDFGFAGNLGLAGLGAVAFVPVIILAGPILAVLGGLVAGGLMGTGVGGVLGIDAAIREKVFQNGCDQFVESLDKTFDNIDDIIATAFHKRLERVDEIVSRTIFLYETLLEQQGEIHQKNLEQREEEKAWIAQKRLELENLKNSIQTVLIMECMPEQQ